MSNKVWYIEALDSFTNEVIATEVPSEMAQRGVYCQDGKTRDFWECTYQIITKLLSNQANLPLRFTVFYREGRHGPVKPWPFAKKKKPTLAQAMKKGQVKKATS